MIKDMQCPYCNAWQEVCHDDGFGYEEGERHETECSECDKAFVFETSIVFYYESFKADCLNDGEHKLQRVHSTARYDPPWMRCEDCDYETKGKYVSNDGFEE